MVLNMADGIRKNKIDAEKGAKEIYEGAINTIDPPLGIDLGKGVRPYWDKLVKAKAGRNWLDQDLLLLVELSRNLFRTERLSRQMLDEEEVTMDDKGVMKANPKSAIIDQLVKRARLIYSLLKIHAEATQGKSRDQVPANKAHTEIVQAMEDDDDLIASPNQAH
jgi:hypothetical protein